MKELAEAVGFEPKVGFHLRWFSRPEPSTTRPHFLWCPLPGSNRHARRQKILSLQRLPFGQGGFGRPGRT